MPLRTSPPTPVPVAGAMRMVATETTTRAAVRAAAWSRAWRNPCSTSVTTRSPAPGGPASARIAAGLGDGLFATEPEAEMVVTWVRLGGSGPA